MIPVAGPQTGDGVVSGSESEDEEGGDKTSSTGAGEGRGKRGGGRVGERGGKVGGGGQDIQHRCEAVEGRGRKVKRYGGEMRGQRGE